MPSHCPAKGLTLQNQLPRSSCLATLNHQPISCKMFYLTPCSLSRIGVFPTNQPSHKASGHPSVKVGGRSFFRVVDICALEASKTLAHRTMELLKENTKPKGICHRNLGLWEILIFIMTSHAIFLWMESWHRGCAEGDTLSWSHDSCRTH